MKWLRVIGLSVLAVHCTSAYASPSVSFKELALGMSKQTVEQSRKLKCQPTQASSILTSTTVRETRSIRKEESLLSSRARSGDIQCSVKDPGTVGGMKIAYLELRFYGQLLGQIEISIAERGRSDLDYRGGGIWSSDNLTILIKSLNDRFGQPTRSQEPDCSGGIGGCLRAPLKIKSTWHPQDAEVKLMYWQSTTRGTPTLVYTSNPYQSEMQKYRAKADTLRQQAEGIEHEVAIRRAATRSADL